MYEKNRTQYAADNDLFGLQGTRYYSGSDYIVHILTIISGRAIEVSPTSKSQPETHRNDINL